MGSGSIRIFGYDGTPVEADPVGSALTILSSAHCMLHDGHMFVVSDDADVADAATREIRLQTPNSMTEAHMVIEVSASLNGSLDVYEATSKTHVGGNALTPLNRNRNSSDTSVCTVCHTPGGSGDGTRILSVHVGTSGNPATAGGGARSSGQEFILKRNTAYLVRFTSGAADNNVAITLNWYEHRTNTYTTTTTSTTSTTSSSSSSSSTTAP